MGLLTLAGMASGAGQMLGKGLETAQSYLVQSFLQEERNKMETDRLKLTEQFAGAREQRGYGHVEQLQKEKIASEEGQLKTRMGHEMDLESKREKARAQEASTLDRRKQDAELRETARATHLRDALRREEVDYAKQIAKDPDYLEAIKTLQRARESDLVRAQTNAAQYEVQTQVEDRQLAMDKADATTASLIFRDSTNEITRLTTELTKAELVGADTTAIQKQIDEAGHTQRSARARAAELSGVKLPERSAHNKKGPFAVPEKFAGSPPTSTERTSAVTAKEGDAVTADVMARDEASRRSSGAATARPQGEVTTEPNPNRPPEKPRRGMIDKFIDLLPKQKQHKPKESR